MADPTKQSFTPEDSIAPVEVHGLSGFISKFTVLKGAQRELWLTFLIKFLIYTAYKISRDPNEAGKVVPDAMAAST